MSKVKKQQVSQAELFTKDNYIWMLIGLISLALGFFLMVGGKNSDPKVFNDKETYSTVRITIAPLLIIIGFLIEVYAIMKSSKKADQSAKENN